MSDNCNLMRWIILHVMFAREVMMRMFYLSVIYVTFIVVMSIVMKGLTIYFQKENGIARIARFH